MKVLFAAQIDYIYFIYGSAFFLLAWISFVLSGRKNTAMPWKWLGWFSVLNCLGIWSSVITISYGNRLFLNFFQPTVTAVASVASLIFGFKSFAFAFHAKDAVVRRIFVTAGAAFFIYAITAAASFRVQDIIILPICLALSYFLTATFWVYQHFSENIVTDQSRPVRIRYFTVVALALCAVILAGYLITDSVGKYYRDRFRHNLLLRTETIASLLSRAQVKSLSGSQADLSSADYAYLKNQLMSADAINRDITFVYLAGIRGDKDVFIFADSKDPSDRSYSPPGQDYTEASRGLIESFSGSREPFIEGPLADRWGEWFSAFCPIKDPVTGKVIAILGMDVDAKYCLRDIFDHRIAGILISFLLVIAFMAILQLYGSSFARISAASMRFGLIAQEMGDGIIVCGPDYKAIFINPAAIKYLGIEKTTGINIMEHLSKDFLVNIDKGELADASRPHKDFDIIRKETKHFKPLYLETHLDILKNLTGEVSGIILAMRDVTEKRTDELLKQNFLHFISHKLRTPTSIIRGNVSLLEDGVLGVLNEGQKKAAGVVLAQGILLANLIDKLLNFVKMSKNYNIASKEKVEFKACLEEVIRPMIGALKDKKVELNIDCADGTCIFIDKDYLCLVIENLTDNAIRFNDKDILKIDIRVRHLEKEIEISFSDNGPGIPPEDKDRIFQKFYQVEKKFTGQVKGLGLGLALSKHIIESAGGRIELESGIGKGVKFIITLPR